MNDIDRDLLLSGQVDHTDAARFAAASAPDSGTVGALEALAERCVALWEPCGETNASDLM